MTRPRPWFFAPLLLAAVAAVAATAGRPGAWAAVAAAADEPGWFAFDPGPPERSASALDLRGLNEKVAGENGPIGVKDGRFVRTGNGEPVRFWAVNGPPGQDRASLKREARVLARYGVNLVRVHHGYYDQKGALDRKTVLNAIDVVEAMKAEGIYTHFSVYFPLWLAPGQGNPTLRGYEGDKHPFAALFFNDDFRKLYRSWWQALLTTPSPATGKRLVDDPAVFGLEVQNEDSLFFWTFSRENVPDPQLKRFEAKFGAWAAKRYGSIPAALKKWGVADPRDNPAEGRVAFRNLWSLFNERTARDKDTARFLTETQRAFYADEIAFLRGLGFKGVVTCSNWTTADAGVLGPLEKYSYTLGDFVDRHGYYAGAQEGPDAAWKLAEAQSYADADALRFEPPEPGKSARFENPVMDPAYDGKPSMISETTFSRPNRFRSEAPLYLASYASLQGSDAVVHFAFDGAAWSVKPGFHMQPWTLMSPAMMGQFPAAAVLYRKGLVGEGDLLVDLNLKVDDLLDLKGTPLPQGAALDELRLKDVPKGVSLRPGNVIDPLVHYAGRSNVSFTAGGGPPKLKDLRPFIDHDKKTVSSTNGHLWLDYGKGVLAIRSPSAQGVSGALRKSGAADLGDVKVTSGMDLGHVVAVSLDDRPLARSGKILLQVMSEEKPSDFRTADGPKPGFRTIKGAGRDPWTVKRFEGTVRFKRADAASLKVTALDGNGAPVKEYGHADEIRLAPTTLYYLIEAGKAGASE